MTKWTLFVRLLRPEQWYKNLLIFVAAIFSHNAFNLPLYPKLLVGFLLLSLVSGSSYVLNDIKDVSADREHPRKAKRPLASGSVTLRSAVMVLAGVLAFSLLLSWRLDYLFALLCTALFLLNAAYTLWLKRYVFVDAMSISIGFVIRGVAGGILTGVPLSTWFVYGIFFAALLLALGKRSGELLNLTSPGLHRQVLESYSQELLFAGMTMTSTLVIAFYTLYVTLGPPNALNLLPTVPVVVFIVFRYLYLTFNKKGMYLYAENPFYDRQMLVGGATLLGLTIVFLYFLPPLS